MKCRICNCTEMRACRGGCSWVVVNSDVRNVGAPKEVDVCTRCVPREIRRALEDFPTVDTCSALRGQTCRATLRLKTLERTGRNWYATFPCRTHGHVRVRIETR